MTLAGCQRDLCVEEFKAEAECGGGSWDRRQEADAVVACANEARDTDAYHHCMIACAEGETCNSWRCYTECFCYSEPDNCDSFE